MDSYHVNIIWQAGFLDGEGCVTISKQVDKRRSSAVYRPIVIIVNCNPDLLTDFQKHWGGTIHKRLAYKPKERYGYAWHCPIGVMAKFLLAILPFVKGKKEQINLVLEFLEHKTKLGSVAKLDREELGYRESLRLKAQQLNLKGK